MPDTDSRSVGRWLANTSIILAVVGVVLGAFCWWGMFTAAGQRRFDEMDGLYPFFAGGAGAMAAALSLLGGVTVLWRKHRGG